MFSQRAGSFGWLSPSRYSKTLASTEKLPVVDIVLITHNHPDHLDEDSIKALISKTKHFIAPLAVGSLLEEWGVPDRKLTELDWWQEKSIGNITITAAPAKHTSERGIFDKNMTILVSIRKVRNFYSTSTHLPRRMCDTGCTSLVALAEQGCDAPPRAPAAGRRRRGRCHSKGRAVQESGPDL